MYNEKLEKLIELALADGELTEKEKQILFKNAESEGIDLDEFEMVLDAKLYEITKNSEKNITVAAPKSDKFGDVKKCPSCGSIVETFTTKCGDCGYDFRNIESINSINTFFELYQNIESTVPLEKQNTGIFGKVFGEDDDILRQKREQKIFIKKKELIQHFPIPNSKEDILEFLIMATPLALSSKKGVLTTFKNIKSFMSHDNEKDKEFLISKIWMQKCEQIIMKARLSMTNDKNALEKVEFYSNKLGLK